MKLREYAISGMTGQVITGDRLTPNQRTTYATLVSSSLANSGHNNPVEASVLRSHMVAGRSLVIVESSDKSLLAHAYLTPPTNRTTELGGLYSYARGFGGPMVQATAGHAMRIDEVDHVFAIVRANNTQARRTFERVGAKLTDERISQRHGREIAVFDLTLVGLDNL